MKSLVSLHAEYPFRRVKPNVVRSIVGRDIVRILRAGSGCDAGVRSSKQALILRVWDDVILKIEAERMNEPDVPLRQFRVNHPAGEADQRIFQRTLLFGALVINRHPFPRGRRGEPDCRAPAERQRPVRIPFSRRVRDVLIGRRENGGGRPACRRGRWNSSGRVPRSEHAGGQRTED